MRSLLGEETLAAEELERVGSVAIASPVAATSVYRRRVKRFADVIGAMAMLVVLAPVLVLVTLGIAVFLRGRPFVIAQERVGRGGETFRFYKFRSMMHDRRHEQQPFAGPDRRVHHKSEDDPRHRPFGRALRKVSLDELPQLINVLKGDMSLVGPRPELLDVATDHDMLGHPRELVRPGLTGPFQVSPLRGEGDLSLGLHLDAAYVADGRARTDALIMLKTVGAILRRTGT